MPKEIEYFKTFRSCYELRYEHADGNVQVMLFHTEFEADLMRKWLIKKEAELANGLQTNNVDL